MIHDESPPGVGSWSAALRTEDGPSLWSSSCLEGDELLDSKSERDFEESLRLLDEIWPPDDDDHDERFPRQFGRFKILGELGRGGFGVVYLAEDPLLGRKVALKVPRSEVPFGNEGWRRFLREARAASRFDHPNLIPLLDAGTIGPVGYIVSAFVPGPSLEQWLRLNHGECSARSGARIVKVLARAIEHAHRKKVLHRDLKPANVLLHAPECEGDAPGRRSWEKGHVESWTPRICDFGLAKLREIEADETKSRVACGSPPYMAPEQAEARRDEIGPATDVYGLGTILYELLTGRPPFAGKSDLDTLRKVMADEPVAPRKRRPGVPRDLETICLKCLSKRPGNRYASAAALADDLERYLEGRPVEARPLPIWARGWMWACRKPALATLVAAIWLLAAVGIFGLIGYHGELRRQNKELQVARESAEQESRAKNAQRDETERVMRLNRRQAAAHQVPLAVRAMESRDFEMALRLLDDAEPVFNETVERDFTLSFLRGFIRDRLEVFQGHQAALSFLAVSTDGRTLASGDHRGAIWLWDLPSGKSRRLIEYQKKGILCLAFSLDGRTLASATVQMGETLIWDVPSARLRGRLELTGDECVSSLLFTRDGERVAAVRTGSGQRDLPFVSFEVTPKTGDLPFTFDGYIGAIATELTDQRLQVLANILDNSRPNEPVSLDALKRPWAHPSPRGVARTCDKTLAVVGFGDGTIAVYRLDCGLRLMLACVRSPGTAVVLFDPLDKFGEPRPCEQEQIKRLASSLAAKSSGTQVGSGMIVRQNVSEPAAFSPDGRSLAVWSAVEKSLRIKDLTTGKDCSSFDLGRLNNLTSIVFTPDGGTVAFGAADRKVRLWHLRKPGKPQILPGHSPKEAWCLSFSPDGHTLAAGGDDHLIRLWDVRTGRETKVLRGHGSLVSSVAFAPDGNTLASGSFDVKNPVIVWDLATGLPRSTLRDHTKCVRGLAFSPDGRSLVSGGDDKTTMLWNASSGLRTMTITHGDNNVHCVAFSADGRTVASGVGSDQVVLIDVATGVVKSMATDSPVRSLTFPRDGLQLISGHEDGVITVWDLAEVRRVKTLPGHSKIVWGLSLSSDGRSLASGGEDKTVRVWDIITGQELLCLTDCKARVNAVAFSPDGQTLAAADHSGAISIWQATTTH